MNEIRRPIREADEIDRIRSVVDRHPRPDFVTGFDVYLCTIHDEPAISVVFHDVAARPNSIEGSRARAGLLNKFVDVVRDDLLWEIEGRYPYFRFDDQEQQSQASSDPA